MGQYITLGLNIALLVFVGLGVLFGFIKGLRKSASNAIFLIILSIILLFVTVPITNALLGIKINTNITIGDETIVGYASIKDSIEFFVKHFLGTSFAESNPEFLSIITSLPLVLINAIVYVLLFWVCKILLFPLNYLFYRLTFAPKKKKDAFGFSAFNDGEENSNNSNEIIGQEKINSSPDFDFQENKQNSLSFKDGNIDNGENINLAEQKNIDATDENIANPQNEQNIENDSVNANAEIIQQVEENTFGKEGSFIKTEIEEPKQEHVVPVNFDKPKKEKKKKEKIKYKKHRLWGALIGGFVGLFVMANTLLPVYGFMNIFKNVNELELQNVTDAGLNLSSQTNGMTDEIIKSYDTSILKNFSKYSGIEGLALAEFDLLTTQNINDSKISLRKDIESLVATAKKADEFVGKYKVYLESGNWSTLSQDQISTIIKDAKDLLTVAKSVKVVDCVADYLIPVVANFAVNSDMKISDNTDVNELVIDALQALASSKTINVFDEATSLLDLVDYVNSQGLLVKILQNDLSDPIATINNLDEDFGEQFINKLYNLKTIDLTMPYVLNIGLNFIEQAINYGYEKVVYENIENIKTAFSNIVDRALEVAKSLDSDSGIYITNESLVPLGKLLQTVKVSGIVNDNTYKNLIDFAINKLQILLQGVAPIELEDYVLDEVFANIAKVDNWEQEMTKISGAIRKLRNVENGILGQVVEGEVLRSGMNIEIIMKPGVLRNLGETLDILEDTVLFGARTYKNEHPVSGTVSMFLSILDYADTYIKNSISDTSLQQVTSVFEKIKTNLIESNHTFDSENKFWTNELNSVAPLIIEVYDMLDGGNFDITNELGKSLDQAKSSTMLGNGATLDLMKASLDIVSDSILGDGYTYNDGSDLANPQVLNDKIYELFVAVKNNLSTEDIKNKVRLYPSFWQDEFEYYQSLKTIAENSSNLSSIANAKTLAIDLDKISESATIPQEEIFGIVAFAIEDIKYKNTTDSIELSINALIDKIANRLESDTYLDGKDLTDFWTIEFDHLSNVMNINFNDNNLKNNLGEIGKELDKVVLGYEVQDDSATTDIDESKTVRASYILTSDDLRDVLGKAMDTMANTILDSFSAGTIKQSIQKALIGDQEHNIKGIKDNILDTTNIKDISFEKEMNHLQTLANLEIDSSMLSYPSGTETEIENKLNQNQQKLSSLGQSLDSIAYKYALDGSAYKYTDVIDVEKGEKNSTNSKFITRSILTNLIKDIFDIAIVKIDASDDENTRKEKEAFNVLIENIQNAMENVATADKAMSWQRELGYVNRLVQMNSGATYTIDTVPTIVGSNLDAIAFNVKNGTQTFDDILYDANNTCTYFPTNSGNSLFITRSELKNLMGSYLGRLKETIKASDDSATQARKNAINTAIDESMNKIADNNVKLSDTDNYYPNFESGLTALRDLINSL